MAGSPALRTTTAPPITGAHPPNPRPGQTPHCGQPGRNHPAGRLLWGESRVPDVEYARVHRRTRPPSLDLHHSPNNAPTTTRSRSTLRIADNPRYTNYGCPPTKVRGETTRQGATCQGAPANAVTMTPTVGRKSSTGGRAHPRTPMDSTSTTRPTTHPQQPRAGPHSALRTTPDTPTIGAHQPIPCPG